MADYKKNKVSGHHDSFANSRPSDKTTSTFHRILDNVENILYSDEETFHTAMVVSGHSAPPQSSNETRATPASRTEIFDLGDGIPRFGVQIQIMSNMGSISPLAGSTLSLPSPVVPDIDNKEMEWRTSFFPFAYTENIRQQVPLFGSIVVVREIDGLYYIERIVNKKAIALSSVERQRGSFSLGNYSKLRTPLHLKKMQRTKHLPGMFSKLPLVNGKNLNNYRGGKIKTFQQMYNLKHSFGVKRIVSLAEDAHWGVKDSRFGCGVPYPRKVTDAATGKTTRKGAPSSNYIRTNNCEQFFARELGLEFLGPYFFHGEIYNKKTDQWRIKGKEADQNVFNEVKAFLDQGDTYFHCTHGVDRAGSMAMRYMRLVGGYPPGKAYAYSITVGTGQYRMRGKGRKFDPNNHLRAFGLGREYWPKGTGQTKAENDAKPYFETIASEIPKAIPLVPLQK